MEKGQGSRAVRGTLGLLLAFGLLLGAIATASAEENVSEVEAADAQADTFVASGRRWPYTRWVREARVPGPPGLVVIKHYSAPCLLPRLGCMIWKEPPVVRLGRDGRNRRIFFHELGHAYDYRALDREERGEFAALNPDGWESEAFADAYRNCAIGDRKYHVRYGPHSGWAPAPRWRHRAACRLIREAVDRAQ